MKTRRELAAIASGVSALMAFALCSCDLQLPATPPESAPRGPAAVLFTVDAPLPEFSDPTAVLAAKETSQHTLEKLLGKAATDLNVQEIIVHFGEPDISLARAHDLAAALRGVQAAGKPLTCHFDAASNLTYWIAATACPRILIGPAGEVGLVGLSLESVHIRELLANLGVSADVLAMGKYKDAAEPLTRDAMSDESREAATSLLLELHKVLLEGIAKGRRIDPTRLQQLVDTGPHAAQAALADGLVDEVVALSTYLGSARTRYAGGVWDDYGKEPAKPFSLGDIVKLFGGDGSTAKPPSTPRIALVPVVGPISSGTGESLLPGMEMVYDMDLADALADLGSDESVRAVVLRIDSPGGSVIASDNLWNAVRLLAGKKPVVASLGDVAASGGYYIAAAASEIIAAPATVTGSIGVVGGKIVLAEAAAKIGVRSERITTGRRAALESPFTPFSDDERQAITALMQRSYDLFISRVAEGRRLPPDQVRAAAEGRVWTGSQALGLKLVDKIGGLSDAIARARELAGVPPGTPAEILPEPKTLFEILGEAFGGGETAALAALSRRQPAVRHALSFAHLLLDESVLAISPMPLEAR